MSSPDNYQAIIDDQNVTNLKKLIQHPAIDFKFELDEFQARSIYRLEQNQSVFVSAPTSAGKTFVAQYAISLSLKHGKRVIYTSPIKALSNQKFREFSQQFDDVGIITGDVTINKKASVLIMTTEIFRSMLYNDDNDVIPNVECVIFDEFHYIANEDRGCVWEESIIQMPHEINMVFLSATMPNAKDIANWIATSKKRNIYIEIHEGRPVPLLHSVYISNQIINIVGENQEFNENAYQEASKFKVPKKKRKNQKEKAEKYEDLILNLQKNDLLPALLFIFAIEKIETKASMLMNSNINLLTEKESDHVVKFFNSTMEKIPESDRNLPQISKMINLLKKGIGIHHSGLFPILKETVEILLSEGYVKVILCTSTIGMGLNLPVRTCCFTTVKKFNGNKKSDLTLTEYQQMSGRAGRRGHDKFGISLLCIDNKFPTKKYLQNLFCGKAENVKSQFQISFKMVLNSFGEKGKMGIKEIIDNTFLHSENQPQSDILKGKINELMKNVSRLDHISNCQMVQQQDENQQEQMKELNSEVDKQDDDNGQKEQKQKQKPKGQKQRQKQDDDKENDEQEQKQKRGQNQQNKKQHRNKDDDGDDEEEQKPKGKKQQQKQDDDGQEQKRKRIRNRRGKKQQQQQQRQNEDDDDDNDDENQNAKEQKDSSSFSDDIEDIDFSAPIYDLALNSKKIIEFNLKLLNNCRSDILKGLQKGMMVLFIQKDTASVGFVDKIDMKGKKKNPVLLVVKVFTNGRLIVVKGSEIQKLILLSSEVVNYDNLNEHEKSKIIEDFNPQEKLQKYNEIFGIKGKKNLAFSNELYNHVLKFFSSKCYKCKFFSNHFKTANKEAGYLSQIQANKALLNEKGNIEYQCYLNLLQEMDYIEKDENDHYTLNTKGLVASDVYGHEIFSTELLFSDVFDDCSAVDIATLCSCLVPHRRYKGNGMKDLLPKLIEKVETMNEVAGFVKEKMCNNAIPFDENGFIPSMINTSTLDAVYSWANGNDFKESMEKLSGVLEGHFVAIVTMEKSLLVNYANAAKIMGLADLSEKFNEAADIISHGIISVRSIYLDDDL